MSIQKSIYHGVVALDVAICAIVERVNQGIYALERKAGLSYANALHKETAKAKQTADLFASVAEVAKRDAASAKVEAAAVAKANTAAARRLEADYA